jgi:PAS domain S-box-containing protein
MKNKDKTKEDLLEELAKSKLSEEALQKSEKRYRTLFEKNPYGIQEIDANGTIIYANKAHHDMYGYEEGGLLGRSVTEFLVPGLNRDELPSYLATLVKEQPPPNMYHQKILTKHGIERDIEVAWNYLRDSKGRVKGFISVLTDITERKKTNKSLVDSNAKLEEMNQIMKAVFDQTHIMAVLLDTNFNFIWVNRSYANTCHYEPSFFPGKNHFDLYPHEENEAIFKSVVDTGVPFFIEAKPFEFPDQPERGVTYWDWSLIPVKDNKKVTALVFTLLEVTTRKKAENEVQKAHNKLEQRVKERTLELQEKNTALKVLLTQRENDKKDLEQNILSNINVLIQPYINDLKRNNANVDQVAYLNLIESNLEDIISPFSQKLSSKYMNFTSKEIEIANLIKEGKKDKEIMEIMHMAFDTVKAHRKNIRKKLGITGAGTNLRNKLLSM